MEVVKKLASYEYRDLVQIGLVVLTGISNDCDDPELFELDFDGPFAAVIRKYYDLPTEGDRDYINITEYTITQVDEENNNTCVIAYIDRCYGQNLYFIRLRLEDGEKGMLSYTVETAGSEIDRGLFFSHKNPETAKSAIADFIQYYYGKTITFKDGKCKDLEFLDVFNGFPSRSDTEMINKLSKNSYQPEELCTFEILLCDNEVDTDHDCFSYEALTQLKEKVIGVFDHKNKACIFNAYIESEPTRKTKNGEIYACLKAKAYVLNNEENKPLIEIIQQGKKNKVSLCCSVKTRTCSICKKEKCEHIFGKMYDDKLCFSVINDISLVYEFFF